MPWLRCTVQYRDESPSAGAKGSDASGGPSQPLAVGLLVGLVLASQFAHAGSVAQSNSAPRGWERALAGDTRIEVTAKPYTFKGGDLNGLTLEGAWELKSEHRGFGAISGMLVKNRQLYAVSDKGFWFSAMLSEEAGDLRLDDARWVPMRDASDEAFKGTRIDAEGLAWNGRAIAVSFERAHRIMTLRDSGRLAGSIESNAFNQFPMNNGLEALASLPDGRLIAFAEEADERGVPVFVIDPDEGTVSESRLPHDGIHLVTGADVGPDGHLYLVLRFTRWFLGFGRSIRIMRYRLGDDGFPIPESAEVLASVENWSAIDNMEAIALDRGRDGRMHLWLISDDNFRYWQRTLLLRFIVEP